MDRYLALDEEGYFLFDGRRVDDEELGRTLLENLKVSANLTLTTTLMGEEALVEAFDAPLLVRQVHFPDQGRCAIDLNYHARARLPLSSLSIDEWDRIHGLREDGVPLVFSRAAQVAFFDLLDEFDDDSVTIAGQRYPTPPWMATSNENAKPGFWSEIYQTEAQPRWDLGRETPILNAVLPQLKLNRARILVLGCGAGHDAAYLARQGHLVTAVDFADEAIAQAEKNYGALFKIVKADALNLPESFTGQFDLVFEHTFYAAIPPERRMDLLKTWKRVLTARGELLAVFFVHEKRVGPPFGGSEWEVRQRLSSDFDFLYWTRWRQSVESRKGKELVVYARRKSR